jgi:hypothetical protein
MYNPCKVRLEPLSLRRVGNVADSRDRGTTLTVPIGFLPFETVLLSTLLIFPESQLLICKTRVAVIPTFQGCCEV